MLAGMGGASDVFKMVAMISVIYQSVNIRFVH